MTREELKKVLASKANRLAAEAIEAIKSAAPLARLEEIVESGASDRHYRRDPLHPRSKYRVEHVLDACFQSSFGVVSEKTQTAPPGVRSSVVVLGHIPAQAGRAQHFAYLLDRGFSPGTNGWRGELFPAIMKSCFYRDPVEQPAALELAKILVSKGKVDVQAFAENNYEWTGSPEKLARMMDLGARPSPKMLDCALRYCACAQGPGDPESGRAEVIRALLDAGVEPSRPLGHTGSSRDQVEFLQSAGLLDRIPRAPAPLPSPKPSIPPLPKSVSPRLR